MDIIDKRYSVSVAAISAHAVVCFPILNKAIKLVVSSLNKRSIATHFSIKLILRGFK